MSTNKLNMPGKQSGFSLLELLFVIVLIGILIGMLFPAIRRGPIPEASRRTACSNNIRQFALAALNYESAHQHFPSALGGIDPALEPSAEGAKRISGLVSLLPYMEQNAMWNQISEPMEFDGVQYPAYPSPLAAEYPPWKTQIDQFLCPSIGFDDEMDAGSKSYAFCIGDMARNLHGQFQPRGAYGGSLRTTLGDIADGTSNTIAFAEIASASETQLAKCEFAVNQPVSFLDLPSKCFELLENRSSDKLREEVELGVENRGGRWADGAAGIGMFNTILPPNSPNVAVGFDAASDGIYSAGSFHTGGLNVARCDGSVSFVREDIDAGDLSQPTVKPEQLADSAGPIPSPYGVWGAAGTAAGEEENNDDW